MGVWGAGLFDDDDAADLRSDYRVYLADSQSDAGATDALAKDYGASLDHPGELTSFWLALASIQWRSGRLDPRVKTTALAIIDDGLDLGKWEHSPQRKKRATVLARLRELLGQPLPPAKPLPKPLPLQLAGWDFSELVGYQATNGRYVVLHVLGYRAWSTLWVRAPTVTILNWFEEARPDENDVHRLTHINHDGQVGGHHILCLAMPPRKELRSDQFDRLGLRKPVTRSEATSAVYGLSGQEGGTLDRTLTRVLWPYWEDPTRPVHVPKELPAGSDSACTLAELRRRLFGSPQGGAG